MRLRFFTANEFPSDTNTAYQSRNHILSALSQLSLGLGFLNCQMTYLEQDKVHDPSVNTNILQFVQK